MDNLDVREKQMLVLELNGAEYGFAANKIKEIVRLVEITPVPETPAFLKGIIDYRGDIAVIIDLAERLGMPPAEYTLSTQVVIINVDGHLVGLAVDKVLDVATVESNMVLAAKDNLPLPEDVVVGAFENEERLMVLLDIDKVLDFNDKDYFKKIKKKAAAR